MHTLNTLHINTYRIPEWKEKKNNNNIDTHSELWIVAPNIPNERQPFNVTETIPNEATDSTANSQIRAHKYKSYYFLNC